MATASNTSVRAMRSGGVPTFSDIRIGDFSGGLNLRDAPTELAQNESPDCLNVVLDERGGVLKRLGYVPWTAVLANTPEYGYPSSVCNANFWYSPADGKLYRDVGGTLTNVKTFSAGGRLSMADFVGVCYAIHSTDGLFASSDGITWSAVSAASGSIPTGDQLAVWQNKLWVANSQSDLLSFCAPGDASRWSSTDNGGANYIREGNDFPIVCLYGTSGVDVTAQPALLVGKRSGLNGSIHRVTDASTADYATIDQSAGPGGPGSITDQYGFLYMISPSGIFRTDGQSPLTPIGHKLGRLFAPEAIDSTQVRKMAAGHTAEGRLRFSFAQFGAGFNDRALEYHPLFEAFTMRTDTAQWYVSTLDGKLLGASPNVTGRIWRFDTGGADNGADIASRILTGVFEPGNGYKGRLQHIRILGRDSFKVTALTDFNTSGKEKTLVLESEGLEWDSDGWDDPAVGWGADTTEAEGNFWPRVDGRSFQIKLSETSQQTSTSPPLNEEGAALTVGGWGCFGLRLSFTPLGPS